MLNVQFFRDHKACYNPADVLGEDWSGSILDIMLMPNIPAEDKVWAFTREGAATERQQHTAVCKFAREVWHLMTDPRSRAAIEAKEAWLRGEITDEQLKVAKDAAWAAAARAAAWAAAWAADAAAWAAAWAAARAAAGTAADAAAAAAWAADAAAAAAWAADAADAAADAAAAARVRQLEIIIEILNQ